MKNYRKPNNSSQVRTKMLSCEYIRKKHHFVSGCGMVTTYNKFWRYCPFCGKPIITMNIKYNENY